jgi:membrane fusion protein (multidrug efflux system)
MIRLRFVFTCVVVLLLAVAGCGKSDDQGATPAQKNAAGGKGRGGSDGPGGGKAIPVAVRSAFEGSIASYYKATATLDAEKQAEVLSRVTGMVVSLAVEEGDVVAKGDALLTIGNDEYRLRVQQAAARTANLRSKYDRLKAMQTEGLSTEEEYETARSDLASAEADEGLAKLNLSYTTVRAPFAGSITARLTDVGQNLSVNTALFIMADFDPLLARVHVPSREFNKLRQDQLVDLVLDSSGASLRGRITLISPVIDPTSGTIKITVEVSEYPVGTRPGDFAEVQIVTERRDGVVLLPRSAVITEKGETVVYVATKEDDLDVAERRLVTVGFTDDNNVQITGGLDVGEPVVTRGQRSLKHGTPLKILADEAATPDTATTESAAN